VRVDGVVEYVRERLLGPQENSLLLNHRCDTCDLC
jgi:hypothetical protein